MKVMACRFRGLGEDYSRAITFVWRARPHPLDATQGNTIYKVNKFCERALSLLIRRLYRALRSRDVRAGQQQHARQECPYDERYGDGKWAVNFFEVQPRQRDD